jgi:hypothetical protein
MVSDKTKFKLAVMIAFLAAMYANDGWSGFRAAIVTIVLCEVMIYFIRTKRELRGLRELKEDLIEDNLEEETLYGFNQEFNVLYGRREDMIRHFTKYVPQDKLRIMRAAIMIRRKGSMGNEGVVWTVSAPGRHHNCIDALVNIGKYEYNPDDCEDGFVDSTGKFHGREEACQIAREAGQLFYNARPKTNPAYELFSEDLW